MKKRTMKNLVAVVLLSILVITIIGLCACQKNEETQPPKQEIPKYDSFQANAKMFIRDYIWKDYKKKIEIVTSLEELEKFNILGTEYTNEYFEENVIILIRFRYSGSDTNIEFRDIAYKDGKFYPIFETDSPIAYEDSCADESINLCMVEFDKRIFDYEVGEILVINRRDITCGSSYNRSILAVFG